MVLVLVSATSTHWGKAKVDCRQQGVSHGGGGGRGAEDGGDMGGLLQEIRCALSNGSSMYKNGGKGLGLTSMTTSGMQPSTWTQRLLLGFP